MTDMDVIQHCKDEVEKDKKFTGRTDSEYMAYHLGQIVGAERAMLYLRENKILSPVITGSVKCWKF